MTKRDIPTSYQDARALLGNRDERLVCNNTRLIRWLYLEDAIVLRLHSTNVVRWDPDGRIVLNTGGWNTVTTRDRINRALRLSTEDRHYIFPRPDCWRVGTERCRPYLYRQVEGAGTFFEGRWNRYVLGPDTIIYPDGRTNATPCPRRRRASHTNPDCRCAVCAGKRYDAQMRATWRSTVDESTPDDDYGAGAADGAACRAMSAALASIQRERKEESHNIATR